VDVPPGVVTVISTVPRDPAGDCALIEAGPLTLKLVAGVDPKRTAVAPVKFAPVIVTAVPPVVEPDEGLTALTVGGVGGAEPG
jgi:hypothetical protein